MVTAHASRRYQRSAARRRRHPRPLDHRPVHAGRSDRQGRSSSCWRLPRSGAWAIIFDKWAKAAARCAARPRSSRRPSGRAARSTISTTASASGRADPMSALFAAGDARMAAERRQGSRRDRARSARQSAGAHRAGDGRHPRARDGAARALHDRSRDGRLDRALRRAFRHGLGHHEQLPIDRGVEEHDAGGGRAGHRRGAVRDRAGPGRGDPGRLAYNKFSTDFGRYAERLDGFSADSAPSCRASSTRRR